MSGSVRFCHECCLSRPVGLSQCVMFVVTLKYMFAVFICEDIVLYLQLTFGILRVASKCCNLEPSVCSVELRFDKLSIFL